MIKTILFALVANAFAATGIPAAAATGRPFERTVSVNVSYADLNLARSADQAELDRRLARAARRVCGNRADLRSVGSMHAFRACVADAQERVAPQRLAAIDAATTNRVAVFAQTLAVIAVR
jgi:UrcA family protein